MAKKRELIPGQVWGNGHRHQERTILLDKGDHLVIDDYKGLTSKTTFHRWITMSGSSLVGHLSIDELGVRLMDMIEQAESGYWLIHRLQLAMRAALIHLESEEYKMVKHVLERQLAKLEMPKGLPRMTPSIRRVIEMPSK